MAGSSILVFRIGSLGDSVVALPAIAAVRKNFPDAKLTLISDQQIGSKRVAGQALFEGSGLVDDYLRYPAAMGFWTDLSAQAKVCLEIRGKKYDTLVYLAPSTRSRLRRFRDYLFFRLAGIKNFLGTKGFKVQSYQVPVPPQEHETDQLLGRLALDGLEVPPSGQARFALNLGSSEEKQLLQWLEGQPSDGGRVWVGVGPSAWRPAQIWPEERYALVVERLIRERDVWPVVFGGPGEQELGKRLVERWGRGYSACGVFGIRVSAAAMKRCGLFLGNDTGTIHLAYASGASCVGVYSARNPPGKWLPYGPGHIALVRSMQCEGCELSVCVERKLECLLSIGVDEVFNACDRLLAGAR